MSDPTLNDRGSNQYNDELIERLRNYTEYSYRGADEDRYPSVICAEAAERIEELEAEVERLARDVKVFNRMLNDKSSENERLRDALEDK
jgi:hypothetical protein